LAKELIVDAKPAPGDASDGSGTAIGKIAVPIGAAALLAKLVSPYAGLAGLVAAVAILVVIRKPDEGRTVLSVSDDELTIRRERLKEPLATFPLMDVLDVTTDRETTAQGQTSKERVRLVLERPSPAEPIYIPDTRITPIEAQEWYGKVRTFLRAQGWLPKDER
jgi:hypothetical protein